MVLLMSCETMTASIKITVRTGLCIIGRGLRCANRMAPIVEHAKVEAYCEKYSAWMLVDQWPQMPDLVAETVHGSNLAERLLQLPLLPINNVSASPRQATNVSYCSFGSRSWQLVKATKDPISQPANRRNAKRSLFAQGVNSILVHATCTT
jgi:hypothetical protein